VAGEGSSRWKRRWSRIEKFKIRNSKCEMRNSPRGCVTLLRSVSVNLAELRRAQTRVGKGGFNLEI
jgi:hypothetical protein